MYSVVQFSDGDGGSVSIVNSQWLTPRKCEVYWPPVKCSKTFDRFIQNQSEAGGDWKLYGVHRVFYETDSLEKAKQKLKLSEVTSDLQTEEETEVKKKRIAIRRNRYISSDDEDDNDIHQRPPPLKKQLLNKLIPTQTQGTGPNRHSKIQTNCNDSIDAEDNNENHIISPQLLKKKIVNSKTEEIGPCTSTPNCKKTARENDSDFTQDISLPTLSTSLLQIYEEKVISLLTTIKIQNDQMLSILKQKIKGITLKPDYKLPLKTSEELQATEELLKIQENNENLVSYLETLGGRDTSNKVSRIMKTLMDDCLAKKFNFYGKRSQKLPFCQLLLRNAVVESVKNVTRATEKEIEDNIKVWLKHAPERLLKKEKKN